MYKKRWDPLFTWSLISAFVAAIVAAMIIRIHEAVEGVHQILDIAHDKRFCKLSTSSSLAISGRSARVPEVGSSMYRLIMAMYCPGSPF
jgi:hypothetical protein